MPEPPPTASERERLLLALLDAIDRLRDSMNLALECIERDIRRELEKK